MLILEALCKEVSREVIDVDIIDIAIIDFAIMDLFIHFTSLVGVNCYYLMLEFAAIK